MRIAVLVSGGVDSSVALWRLARAGHDVTAFYLKIWLEDELAFLGDCPWDEDLELIRATCDALDTPLEIVSLQGEYHRRVIATVVDELRAGRTPSPDVLCNRAVKFGAFLEYLDHGSRGNYDRVASGHYAGLEERDGEVRLLRGVDPVKDQTYFLHSLTQQQLRRCLFPLGELTKAEVRRLAREADLPAAERRDSQGLCFLGRVPYDEFVRAHLGEHPGEIRELHSERVLGRHRGLWFHTLGQRRGLGLGGGPWYVSTKDLDANVLYVSHADSLAAISRRRLRLSAATWTAQSAAARIRQLASSDGAGRDDEVLVARVRHSPELVPVRLRAFESASIRSVCTKSASTGPADLEVVLGQPDPGVAPGQCCVLYESRWCLGGGTIALTELSPKRSAPGRPAI